MSPDGSRVVYYEMTTEDTYNAHGPIGFSNVNSQIVSVDFATGLDRVEHTSGSGLRMFPQFLSQDEVGYLIKSGANAGLNYTSSRPAFKGTIRSPSWSPDGLSVVYERQNWTARPFEKQLYSWDSDWDYRFTDVFPQLSLQGKLAITSKQLGDSSIITMNPDGSDWFNVFDPVATGAINSSMASMGQAGAYQPGWSPDGEWITFGLGVWFQARATGMARIMRAKSDGSYYEALTDGTVHSGFPSYSADGRYIAFREWGARFGIRILDLTDMSLRFLTNGTDNLPFWSPDGERIVFTRRTSYTNYDVCTIRPDGTDLQVLTSSGANDAHAVWTADGRIMYCTGMFGFQEEAAIYDNSFQPYGHIMIMNADGSNKTALTDSMWEDSMPLYLPNEILG